MFIDVSEASIGVFMPKYQSLQIKSSEAVMEYVNRLNEIENKLASVGLRGKDIERKRALLRGSREEFFIVKKFL